MNSYFKRRFACFVVFFMNLFLIPAEVFSAPANGVISIGTGGTGGVYYPYGLNLAQIWNKHLNDMHAVAEVTGGSVENTRLIHRGEMTIGEVMGDVAYDAYYGKGSFEGDPQDALAMFVMYQNLYHVVTLKKTEVYSLQDLKGRKVSVGAPGSGTEYESNLILHAIGVPYTSFDVKYLSFEENSKALRRKDIDVGIWSVGPPASSILQLSRDRKIRIISFSTQEIQTVTSAYNYYLPSVIPNGSYKGINEDLSTISVWNVVICTPSLTENLIYELVKNTFENQEHLIKAYPGAKETTPENTVQFSPIPLHPGAVKYFQEIGIEVPAHLMP